MEQSVAIDTNRSNMQLLKQRKGINEMTYQEFKTEMQKLLTESFKYTCKQVGSEIFTEKMADLADQYPNYDEMLDNEV